MRETERQTDRERNIDLLSRLFMHSSVDSCLCPERGSDPKPWCRGQGSKQQLPSQGEAPSSSSVSHGPFSCPTLCPKILQPVPYNILWSIKKINSLQVWTFLLLTLHTLKAFHFDDHFSFFLIIVDGTDICVTESLFFRIVIITE